MLLGNIIYRITRIFLFHLMFNYTQRKEFAYLFFFLLLLLLLLLLLFSKQKKKFGLGLRRVAINLSPYF